jgi:hypothetical protein
MDYSKGDLVLVSNGTQSSTCIILTEKYTTTAYISYSFYYSYCLETGIYGLIYEDEIIGIVVEGFAPDFHFESELFDLDYSFYEHLSESWAYFPYATVDCDEDDEE